MWLRAEVARGGQQVQAGMPGGVGGRWGPS